jgi:DNA repair protein RecN (Recombination protein N)
VPVLIRLQIDNMALIEHAELELERGLNVFTGETGAGKTMLAQAIGLLTGAAPGAGLVGPHAEEAYVEAEFEVPEGFFDDEPLAAVAGLRPEGETTLVVARRLTRVGRSRALVWGRSCARADLEALGGRLLEISSQHEARRLGRAAYQLALLDAHAGHGELLAGMADAWAELRRARAAAEGGRAQIEDAERRRAELEALVARVDEAAPQPGEAEDLARERERLRHLDELAAASSSAAALVNPEDGDGALSLASRAAELVAGVERFEPQLAAVAAELRDSALRLQEASIELRGYLEGLEARPGRLEWVEGRLALFAELERRYGAPLDEVVRMASQAREALEALDGTGDRQAALEAAAEAALHRAEECAARLAQARRESAAGFSAAVERELADLGMEDARLQVTLSPAGLGPRGGDELTLMLAANPGLPALPLAASASGGELSRIALAVRVAARQGGGPEALLLDEVDAGVGGRTARAVGEKLRRLAGSAQLLCITHLPQIAGLADAHFRVEKSPGDPTVTAITRLEGDEVVDELARMLGGGPKDETARRHAAALRG